MLFFSIVNMHYHAPFASSSVLAVPPGDQAQSAGYQKLQAHQLKSCNECLEL